VSDATVQLDSVRIALAGKDAGRGILDWALCELANTKLDGLPTSVAKCSPASTPMPGQTVASPPAGYTEHINGIVGIDHVVAMTPNLDRSVEMLQAAGLDLRRIREQPTPAGAPRQAFFRLGEVILEVVQEPEEVLAARPDGTDGPARFWGLALLSEDLELTVEQLGEHVSEIRAAVQPGRRIATLRRSAGLAVPVALISRADQ
jgi:catechol 2,3-dioxygenase-like lactoylglutathione lyase family enzyme